MSKWTHNICDNCWDKRNSISIPVKIIEPDEEPCCFCGKLSKSGIFVRHDPTDKILSCKGQHG